jgi:hypothetical protein
MSSMADLTSTPRRHGQPIYGAGKSERRISEFVRISRCLLWGGRRIQSRDDPAGEGGDCVCCARSTADPMRLVCYAEKTHSVSTRGPHGGDRKNQRVSDQLM